MPAYYLEDPLGETVVPIAIIGSGVPEVHSVLEGHEIEIGAVAVA